MGAISIRGMTQQNGRSKQISFPWPGGTRGIGGTQADMATLGQQLAAHPHRPPTARHTLEKGVVIFAECTCRSKRNLRARCRSALPGRAAAGVRGCLCLACSRYDAVLQGEEPGGSPRDYRRTK
jgi:hypothetical protein